MPDKQNESKIMAMLERRGIVRKVDSEDEQAGAVPNNADTSSDAQMRSMLGQQPPFEPPRATPAARQPVPGMPNPVIPAAQAQAGEQEYRNIRPESSGESSFNRYPGGVDSFTESTQWDDEAYPAQGAAGRPEAPARPANDYSDRYLDIDELYEALSLKSKRTETIYLVEEYLKSLPDSLPDDSRREIVGKIIVASGFDYDILMGDGVLRVKMLKEYAERFSQQTDEYVSARQGELDALEQQIIRIQKLIESRRDLHKKQFFTIETEAQRLKDILTFISG